MDFGLTAAVGSLLPEMRYELPYLGMIDLGPYAIAAILFAGLIVAFKIIQHIIIARLKILSQKTSTDLDDVLIGAIANIKPWVYTLVAFYIAMQPFVLPSWLDTTLTLIFLFSVVWQLIESAVSFIDHFAARVLKKDEDGDGEIDPNSTTAAHMVGLMARIILWAFGGLFVLSNLGIEITSLIAGLGIGGIAIAFALQGILSDLFSSFSIYFDKPFRIGDYIVIGQHDGIVEKIGIKTTRIRTLQGEELVVSNAELTSTRVQNFKKMAERRIATRFGILYETPFDTIKAVPGMIEHIFKAHDGARLDRVHFSEFGDSALLFDLVYYVDSPDYAKYMDIQQAVNFEIMEKFAEQSIEFAYPTQTVHMKK